MKHVYLLLTFIISTIFSSKAQTANQYHFAVKAGVALEDMSVGAVQLSSSQQDGVVSGPHNFFPFTFSNSNYNQFSVSEDGVVTLGAKTYTPYAYDNYFNQQPAILEQEQVYPIILPWGEDLVLADGSISYKITGVSPSRKLTIEFKVKSAEDILTDTYNKTFQVWLFEKTNTIQFVYGSGLAEWWNNANVGIASSSADFISVNTVAGTTSSTAVFGNSGSDYIESIWPGARITYIFSPTEITDPVETVDPATPISANVFMLPEYPVEGQQKHTIYLGYGAQSVRLGATDVEGGNSQSSYTYSWKAQGQVVGTSATVDVAPKETTDYTVTIEDGKGTSTSKTITVVVVDARCGDKVVVCKDGKEVCIAEQAVKALLNNKAVLGPCTALTLHPSINNATVAGASTVQNADRDMWPITAVSGDVSVYPNPTNGIVQVTIPEMGGRSSITVFDAGGKPVMQRTMVANEKNARFDLSNNPGGIYTIRLANAESIKTFRVVKR